MAKSQQLPLGRARPERTWLLLDYLGIGTKTTLFLGPNGQPMIINDDLRQSVPVRSERLVDYLYFLYESKLGRHDIPSASAIRAVQRVLAGKALKEGTKSEDGVNADPLLDTLLTLLQAAFGLQEAVKFKLPDLAQALKAKATVVGYDTEDLPLGTAELSKQIRERIEALQAQEISTTFSRDNTSRYVEFRKLNWQPKLSTDTQDQQLTDQADQEDDPEELAA